MAPEDHPRNSEAPDVGPRNLRELTEAELEALEDAEDLRIGIERSRLAKVEGTVSWESVKAKYGLEELTDAEREALEDAEDVRVSQERLKTEDSVSWESIKAKHGL